jgi:hypothetical protein
LWSVLGCQNSLNRQIWCCTCICYDPTWWHCPNAVKKPSVHSKQLQELLGKWHSTAHAWAIGSRLHHGEKDEGSEWPRDLQDSSETFSFRPFLGPSLTTRRISINCQACEMIRTFFSSMYVCYWPTRF